MCGRELRSRWRDHDSPRKACRVRGARVQVQVMSLRQPQVVIPQVQGVLLAPLDPAKQGAGLPWGPGGTQQGVGDLLVGRGAGLVKG